MKNVYFLFLSLTLVCSATVAQQNGPLTSAADAFYIKQDWQAAAKGYENAFAKGEVQNALSVNKLGFSYLNLGKYDLAITNLELALTKNPLPAGEPIIRSRLARAYAANKQTDKALEELDSAIVHGYSNIPELDTVKEYNSMRED